MEPMAIEPDLVEEVARRLQLSLRRDVGVSGGMLLYSEHHRWVDFSLYVCPGFLSVLGIVPEGPHLGPEFDQEVLQSPLLDRALRALTGLSRDQIRERDPAAGMFDAEDLVEMAGNQLMMKIGARRLGPMSPELLSEFIEQTMAALSVSGIPLSMLCQQCGRGPGQRLLRPDMLYRLERLCQDCRPQEGATRKRYNTDLSELFGSALGMDPEELGRSDLDTIRQGMMQRFQALRKLAEPEPPAAPSQPDRRRASRSLR